MKVQYLIIVSLFAALLGSCGGSKPSQTAGSTPIEQRLAEGKKQYQDEKWLEAIAIFDEIRLQAPSSDYAAEATFLEGMARYNSGTYISAVVDFRTLRRNYPSSPLAPRAQYMIASSYDQLSPRAELDQTYTQSAINEYQTFLRDYSTAPKSLLDSAETRISDLRNKQALKILLSAELYIKLLDNKSALQYFGRVIDNYYDTPSAIEAQLRIAEVQFGRKKNKEAQDAILAFDERFLSTATPAQRQRALALRQQLSLK